MAVPENDIRLLRRMLICQNVGDEANFVAIRNYLRGSRALHFILPKDLGPEVQERLLNRLPPKEQWLARRFGWVFLPAYYDIIFLNSQWPNPRTLYVRLTEEVPLLGEAGRLKWVPKELEKNWLRLAEKYHAEYLQLKAPRKALSERVKTFLTSLLTR